MADGATFDWVIAAFRTWAFFSIKNFFVGEDGAEGGAEPDRFFGNVGEAVAEKFEEDPLRPAEIFFIGGGKFAIPVDAEADHLKLATEVIDVFASLKSGVFAGGDGVLFGGESKSVPAHRVKDVEA